MERLALLSPQRSSTNGLPRAVSGTRFSVSDTARCLTPSRGRVSGTLRCQTPSLIVIYHQRITHETLSTRAYGEIRGMIIRLELAPGEVVREEELQRQLGIGRTPIREALQRLARDQFVTVMPRRGMLVSSIDVSELSLLFETRAV